MLICCCTNPVYNHVLRLDLNSLQWSLVDNFGDIPGVRMGTSSFVVTSPSTIFAQSF